MKPTHSSGYTVEKTTAPADRRWALVLHQDTRPQRQHMWGFSTKRAATAAHAIADRRSANGAADTWPAPTVTWHAWGASTANLLGVSKGWAGLAGQEVPGTHKAARHVATVMTVAGSNEPTPPGITGLDLRGLSPDLAACVVEGLVVAENHRALDENRKPRGGILLCDDRTAYLIHKTVQTDASA